MSEKEERILIIPCSGECNCIRPVGNELYCGAYTHKDWAKIDPEKDCKDCSRAQYNGIPRSEAVERMAAAMCMRANRIFDCKDCLTAAKGDCEVRAYHNIAGAALDSLLKV